MEEFEDKLRYRCDTILRSLFGEQMAVQWWHSRNKAFDMLKPQEIWEMKDYNRVYVYLLDQANGHYL
ncbi:MAG: hypothetical protein EBU90_07325 [Proteobacteria bacterium]|nr:hypothetical protein [Pseudomonadota bacterium]NBP13486.1 hypothetical protein [bacterium]